MESVYAAFKASLVPVNVNYRYQAEELHYLLDNSDAEIVVVHEDFAPLLEEVLPDLPKVVGVLVVQETGEYDIASIGTMAGAAPYEATAETDRPAVEVELSPDDLMFVYTGGDVAPRRHFHTLRGRRHRRHARDRGGLPRVREGPGPTLPLPHQSTADARYGLVSGDDRLAITIVGDPFAVPMAQELEDHGDAYDISSVVMIASSGVMWSAENKQRLLTHHSGMMLADAFGSSEAVGLGLSLTTAEGSVQTGRFELSDSTKLFNADFELIETKPGARGLVGVGGLQPIGYYKDPEASAKTFIECEAGRFSVPAGGEKVFPEEVEEVIKRFDGVKDAVVVGVPDERWGEAIIAVVSSHEGELNGDAIIEHVKGSLAGYKAPKHVVQVPEVYRSPAGKPDFKRTRQTAMEELGLAG
ncbi:MAG: AMP-binding protein [Deltaproteobacteria bacterium]|nr:AMP-binding protein [Deltaproteobacteria bacterium]